MKFVMLELPTRNRQFLRDLIGRGCAMPIFSRDDDGTVLGDSFVLNRARIMGC